ncbi:MAG: acyl-CoA dehydrogenase family protein [Siculibacillus sp.]
MNFDLSEEQSLLGDSLAKWAARSYDFEHRQKIAESEAGRSAAVWAELADLGLHGLPFAESDGGYGGGPVETMIVMEAIGRALVTEPWATSVVLAGALLRHGASAEQRAELVPAIAAGELILAPALWEAQGRWHFDDVLTRAAPVAGGVRLTGAKAFVVHGAGADRFVVSARTSGDRRSSAGIGLYLVPRAAPGVGVVDRPAHDGTRVADLVLSDVFVPGTALLGDPDLASAVIERAVDEAIAAVCAEAVGAMDEALKMTVDYLKTRVQFGKTIGSFQALQHRAADMYVAVEQARSMALWATMSVGDEDAVRRAKAMSAAKIQIARSARFVGQQAIQLHGGIGMTWEYKVGHLFKRLTLIESQFGDLDHHLDRLAATDGLLEPL